VIIAANRSAADPTVLHVDRLADGDVAPIRHIGGTNTGCSAFRQLKVDSERG
jgi:hypothetical protein